MDKENFNWKPIVITVLIQIAVTAALVALFAVIINLTDTDYKYAPVLASVAVALGSMISSYYMATKKKNRGYIIGGMIGASTFGIITIVGLILNDGGMTVNTLFHLIIIMLSSIIGGIAGVNKKGKKYV